MGELVKLDGGAVAAGTNSDSELLKAALADAVELDLGSDDEPPPGGADLRRVAWKLPARITVGMIEEAQQQVASMAPLLAPITQDAATKWLVSLGMVTASTNTTSGEAAAKATAMWAAIEDFPAGCFTRGSYKRACERFKFFPTASELIAFLREEERRITGRADRLRQIIDAGPRETAPVWSKAIAAEHKRRLEAERQAERERLREVLANTPEAPDVPGFKRPVMKIPGSAA